MGFKIGQEVFHTAFQIRGRFLRQEGDQVLVKIHEDFPPQVWDASKVELYDYSEVEKLLSKKYQI
jgi:hypothetical protein